MKAALLICCVAGKSGGHILPCLQFAKTHYNTTPEIIFISTTSSLDATILAHNTISQSCTLHLRPIPYKAWWKLPLFIYDVVAAFFTSLRLLYKKKPARIVSTGGFISVPVCLAAWILCIPIDLIELNAVPGKATAALHRIATRTFICFKEAQAQFTKTCTLTNYPLRFTEQPTLTKEQALAYFDLPTERKTILVLGGSQGSEFLNEAMQSISLEKLQNYNVIHQTGTTHQELCKAFYQLHKIPAYVFAFESDLIPHYAAADFVICRAGAGSLFETLFFKKRCLIIPLEIKTTDHQFDNARAFQKEYPDLVTVLRQIDYKKDPQLFFTQLP